MNEKQSIKGRISQLETWIPSKRKTISFLKEKVDEIEHFNNNHNMNIHNIQTVIGVIKMLESGLNAEVYWYAKELEELESEENKC